MCTSVPCTRYVRVCFYDIYRLRWNGHHVTLYDILDTGMFLLFTTEGINSCWKNQEFTLLTSYMYYQCCTLIRHNHCIMYSYIVTCTCTHRSLRQSQSGGTHFKHFLMIGCVQEGISAKTHCVCIHSIKYIFFMKENVKPVK